jgi:hypothetical protein
VESTVTEKQPIYEQKMELMEVKTEDGKFVKAFVPVTSGVQLAVVQKEQTETYEPTPEQKLRLNIISWIAIAMIVFFSLLALAWLSYFVRKSGKPPKVLDDMFRTITTLMLGAVMGFLGTPSPDVKAIAKSPSSSQPHKEPPQPGKASQPS